MKENRELQKTEAQWPYTAKRFCWTYYWISTSGTKLFSAMKHILTFTTLLIIKFAERVSVWCRFWTAGIIEESILENEANQKLNLTSALCDDMTIQFFLPKLDDVVSTKWCHMPFNLWNNSSKFWQNVSM